VGGNMIKFLRDTLHLVQKTKSQFGSVTIPRNLSELLICG